MEGSLSGLCRYPEDTRRSIGEHPEQEGLGEPDHLSDEVRPPISIQRGKDVNLGLLRGSDSG